MNAIWPNTPPVAQDARYPVLIFGVTADAMRAWTFAPVIIDIPAPTAEELVRRALSRRGRLATWRARQRRRRSL